MTHEHPHPQAGQTVTVTPAATMLGHRDPASFEFVIEDWQDRVFGRSWMDATGNPACLDYAVRSGTARLPLDNEVVYGKDDHGLGHLVHVSEIQGAQPS